MASWTQNQPSGNSTRRKWKLEDRNSLNNLKLHIAAEGCSEVQFDLAKKLLENRKEPDGSSCTQQAIHWLISAAQQGHDEAVKLLEKCYEGNIGITSENEAEVRCCLSMTPGEKAARKAARELFACLANGGEHITPKQLEKKMRQIYNMQKKRKRHDYSSSTSDEDTDEDHTCRQSLENGPPHFENDKFVQKNLKKHQKASTSLNQRSRYVFITEEHLVSAAAHYSAGRMPAVNDSLTLSVPDPGALDHIPCFQRMFLHPTIFFTLLYHRMVNFISSLPPQIPTSARIMILVALYWLFSFRSLNVFIPLCMYFISLTIMIWSTCKMLKTKQDFIDFRIWSGLFLRYGDQNIEADISENRFLKNNMKPYLYFFGAFVMNMVIYPLIDVKWLPHSELTILSGIMLFVSLIAFMYTSPYPFPDFVVLSSFGVNVLAKYPYEMDDVVSTSWRFLDLRVPTFPSFVIGNGIEFCLNCRTALYLLIPLFLCVLARRSNWRGSYTYLIPHCVTLAWLQLCITTSQRATMFGMARAALGLAGIVLFLPLFGIVSLLIPVFVVIDYMGFADPTIRLGSSVVAGAIAIIGSCYLAINHNTKKYVTVLQVIICILTACILTFPYMTSHVKEYSYDNIPEKQFSTVSDPKIDEATFSNDLISKKYLRWNDFIKICGPQTWENQNKIASQLRCAHLNEMMIDWDGYVSKVQISRISNIFDDLIPTHLPQWLGNMIRCIIGESVNCDTSNDPLCQDVNKILNKSRGIFGHCSMQKWNTYEYEISVNIPNGFAVKSSSIILSAKHNFGNFTKNLVHGDRLHFHGRLYNTLKNDKYVKKYELDPALAYVELTSITCVKCQVKDLEAVSLERGRSPVDARIRDLKCGIKYLLNALLNPLIIFK